MLPRFFELFGFQAVALTKRDQKDVVLMNLIAHAFRERAPRLRQVAGLLADETELPEAGASRPACSFCRRELQAPALVLESFGGYECSRCRFLRVYGSLTLGPPKPAKE